jgi:hypothetical protein
MNDKEQESWYLRDGFRQKERIDTQIHRRRKIKVFSSLKLEWESAQAGVVSGGARNTGKEADA